MQKQILIADAVVPAGKRVEAPKANNQKLVNVKPKPVEVVDLSSDDSEEEVKQEKPLNKKKEAEVGGGGAARKKAPTLTSVLTVRSKVSHFF